MSVRYMLSNRWLERKNSANQLTFHCEKAGVDAIL